MITLDVTFHRRLVRASVGDLIRVDLPEDATAGSRWVISEALPAELRLVKDTTVRISSVRNSSSAGGSMRRLELRVMKTGGVRLRLEQSDPWRSSQALFEVYIDARPVDSEPRLEAPPPSSRRPHVLVAGVHGRTV